MSIFTRARRLKEEEEEEEARTHLSTERKRDTERKRCDDHRNYCFWGARSLTFFWRVFDSPIVVSFAAAKGVALTTSRSETASPSFLSRARALDLSERKTPPAVAASRARLVIDASLKPSVFRLCARAHTRERDRERDRERQRTKSASFKRRDDGLTLSPITTLSSHKIESKINRFNARVYGKRTESNNTRGRDFFD